MEESFKKFIEDIKREDLNTEELKRYIIIIKRYLDKIIANCEGELSKEECLQQYLEEYEKDLEVDNDYMRDLAFGMSQYNSYKDLLKMYKESKTKFKKVLNDAKKKEEISSKEELNCSLDPERQIITSLREIIRKCPKANEKQLIIILQKYKKSIGEYLKDKIIPSIQDNVSFINEYGILDEYIEAANEELQQLDLVNLSYKKRNPLPDEIGDGKGNIIRYNESGKLCKYDEKGQIIDDGEDLEKYEEDIGVLDSFDEDNLQKLSPEDLLMMDTFWRSRYLQERIGISKGMSAIRFLDLWPMILNQDENAIKSIDNESLINALKRDLALTYLYKKKDKLNLKIKTQYSSFLRKANMKKRAKLEDEIQEIEGESKNLIDTSTNASVGASLVLKKLKSKDFSVKDWGVIEYENYNDVNGEEKRNVIFAVENMNFRGAIIMRVTEDFFKTLTRTEDLKLPKYKNADKINERYSHIMSKLYIPTTPYFKNQTWKNYKENPSSELRANLVGKKAKKVVGTEQEGEEGPSL